MWVCKLEHLSSKNTHLFRTIKFNTNIDYACNKGPYIKYAGGGAGKAEVFVGLMKCSRHRLMGHEIFSTIFDGLLNIFFCLMFYFRNFVF